jgi:acetolactate synthase-1/2/3 large subunit
LFFRGQVVDIDGDASFMMTLTEMATAAEFNIGVKVLLLNNNFQVCDLVLKR